jgi:hypothetical protein
MEIVMPITYYYNIISLSYFFNNIYYLNNLNNLNIIMHFFVQIYCHYDRTLYSHFLLYMHIRI